VSATSDIYMRIIMSASQGNAISTVESVARSLGGSGPLGAAFKAIKSGVGDIVFGLRNLGTAGTVGMDALKQGAASAALGITALSLLLAAVVGVAAIGLGVIAVKAASDFQTAMLSLVAHAGLAKNQFDKVSQSVLAMSSDVGRSPTQLAEALYPILSAFSNITNQSAKTDLALHTLKLSFEAVAGTTVSGTAVANAAVGTFNALGLATNNAATNAKRMTGLMDIMDLTVQQGNMQWDAYKNVISKLAVSIQGTGIKFTEASAALATLTNMGYSAQKAQTYLSNTFTTLGIKTDTLAKHAAKLGISFDQAKYGPMSLADKIQYLNQITDGNKQKLLALMGNNSTALKTFNALSTGINGYKTNLQALNHAQGALKTSFDTASQGFSFQMSRIKAAGEAILITIGTKLLPVISSIAAKVTPVLVAFAQWIIKSHAVENVMAWLGVAFQTAGQILAWLAPIFMKVVGAIAIAVNWFMKNKTAMEAVKDIAIGLGAVIAGIVVVALILMAVMVLPIIVVLGVLIGIIMLVITVIRNWGNIGHWFMGIWAAIGSFIAGVWNRIVGAVKAGVAMVVGWFVWLYNHNYYFKMLVDTIKAQISMVIVWLQGAWKNTVTFLAGIWGDIVTGAKLLWSKISSIFSSAWAILTGPLHSLWNNIVNFASGWPSQAASWGVNLIQGFINGIGSMLGNVSNAAQNVMSTVANIMGFHSPAKEGPGKELDIWGPNLIKGFTQGMLKALPELQSSLNLVMTPVGRTLSTPPTGSSAHPSGGGSINVSIVINNPIVDSDRRMQQMGDDFEQRLARKFLRQNPTFAAGGIH
jgi:TP901 family phage tail tape measure protein